MEQLRLELAEMRERVDFAERLLMPEPAARIAAAELADALARV